MKWLVLCVAVLSLCMAVGNGCAKKTTSDGEFSRDGGGATFVEHPGIDSLDTNIYPVSFAGYDYKQFLSEYPLFNKLKNELTTGGGADFYTMHLHHAGEPDLSPVGAQGSEVYRLISMDAGATHSRILRLQKTKGELTLTSKRLNAHGVFSGGKGVLEESKTMKLTDKQWSEFQDLLTRAAFWGLPTANPTVGLDGRFFLVEGVTPTRSHIVSRWSGAPGNYLALFNYLEKAAEAGGKFGDNADGAPPNKTKNTM